MKTTRRQTLAQVAAGATALAIPSLLLAQNQPLRIGAAVPSTGPMSFLGNDFLAGTKLAAYQINKTGGLLGRQVEIVARDDKFSGAGAVAAAREFAGMGINLQMGGAFTPQTLAVAPILDEIKSVFVCIASFTLSVTHEYYSRNVFRPSSNNYMVQRGLARSALEQFKGTRRWQAVVTDNAFGRDAGKVFMDGLREFYPGRNAGAQAEILAPIAVNPAQTDFQLQINQMMAAGVDGVFLAVPGAPGVAYHRQARQLGFDKRYKVVVDAQGDGIAKQLGGDIPENLWTFVLWPYQAGAMKGNAASQQALLDYTSMSGEKFPSTYVGGALRSTRVLFEGIRKARSTETQAVIEAIETLSFDFFGEPFQMRKEDHQGIGATYFAKVVAADVEPRWTLSNVLALPGASLVEPATPGKPFGS